MPFRHDAGIFRPNGVSRRNFDGLKTPNPSSFGDWGVIGKKVEAKNPTGSQLNARYTTSDMLRLKEGNITYHQMAVFIEPGGVSWVSCHP
jgi:hypothetical protein